MPPGAGREARVGDRPDCPGGGEGETWHVFGTEGRCEPLSAGQHDVVRDLRRRKREMADPQVRHQILTSGPVQARMPRVPRRCSSAGRAAVSYPACRTSAYLATTVRSGEVGTALLAEVTLVAFGGTGRRTRLGSDLQRSASEPGGALQPGVNGAAGGADDRLAVGQEPGRGFVHPGGDPFLYPCQRVAGPAYSR